MGYRLGVDVGGTFTDLVLVDEDNGDSIVAKVPSTPQSPDQGVINGIKRLFDQAGLTLSDLSFFIHGTTVATNALIERKGVKVALITTNGFRDVLHIGRQNRPKLYEFQAQRPDPLVPRQLRFEVPERILHTGEVMESLDEDAVRETAKSIASTSAEIVVVCLMNSYVNPRHEIRIREILCEELPNTRISISTEIMPAIMEYERTSTAVINAYVMPIIERYLQNIRLALDGMGIDVDLHIMQSNGGVMTSETASNKSVHTVLSGPAAGAIGAIMLGKMIGIENTINVDMGGTSFDISLAYKGNLNFCAENEIAGYITRVPMIDIKTLGAGGGSIAWIDTGGALQVGPRSAGAFPGPVCYQRGGTEPTVSDANAVLGYLNPDYMAGGDLRLDVEAARKVIEDKIARPLNMSIEDAAAGILRVVNSTMIKGIRVVSVEQGYDPRQFSLISFGGAGPVHAVMLADELDVPNIIIPINPGLACALGLLMADFRHDYVRTYLSRISAADPGDLNSAYANLEEEAISQMLSEKVPNEDIVIYRQADMRYAGQGYSLEIDVPSGILAARHVEGVSEAFHSAHEANYGYRMPDHETEFVSLRITSIGLLQKPVWRKQFPVGESPDKAFKGYRSAYMCGEFADLPVYERTSLMTGNLIDGPAIIEQLDTTTVVLLGYEVKVDEYGNLLVTRKVK